MSITIKTIPHSEQRYNTVGDYQTAAGATEVRISKLGDEKMETLVAMHELVELLLCKFAGVTDKQIDEFDFAFDGRSPGDDPTAPYHRQHIIATEIEKIMARELGVNWEEYDARITEVMRNR